MDVMHEITPKVLDKWRADLRVMTRIYKSIPAAKTDEEKLGRFREAQTLFNNFRKAFEKWSYRELLPIVDREKGSRGVEEEVRKQVWNALGAISNLFPQSWNYHTERHEAAPWELERKIDTNIRRYQRAFNDAFKVIEEYLEGLGGTVVRHPMTTSYSIGGMTVVVHGLGLDDYVDDVDKYLRNIKGFAGKIRSAGFGDAIENLMVHITMADPDDTRAPNDLRAGQYDSSSDELLIFGLGFVASDGGTFIHEVGHRFWYKQLGTQARAAWTEAFRTRTSEITEGDVVAYHKQVAVPATRDGRYDEDRARQIVEQEPDEVMKAKFRELVEHVWIGAETADDVLTFHKKFEIGEKVHIEDISSYATTNPVEAFAEAFRFYVLKGPGALGPWTRQYFREVSRSGGAKLAMIRRVIARHLART